MVIMNDSFIKSILRRNNMKFKKDKIMFPLISPKELYDNLLSHPDDICIVDASYGPVSHDVFLRERIGQAVFFDIDEVADHHNPLPHMVPSAAQFSGQVGAMGISNDKKIIVYDQAGIIMAACRAWWMFRLFGHKNVVVLNGGLPAWKAAGYELSSGEPSIPKSAVFIPDYQGDLYATMDDVEKSVAEKSSVIIDARPNQRFFGVAAEPRPNMNAGHIPMSCNVPALALVQQGSGEIYSEEYLKELFAPLGLSPESRIITTCGSGVTACVDALALHILGFDKVAVYDGSWSEWGAIENNKPFVKN